MQIIVLFTLLNTKYKIQLPFKCTPLWYRCNETVDVLIKYIMEQALLTVTMYDLLWF